MKLEEGSTFAGKYRVVRPIVAGAIHEVEHIESGARRALIFFDPRLVKDPSLRDRWVREVEVVGLIESAHVVGVVEAGVDDDTPWVATEPLAGETLATLIARKGSLDLPELRAVFGQLCQALVDAHEAGIIHGDLKPEHVFLATPGKGDSPFTVKLLGFGIGRLVAEARADHPTSMGSPLWLAPEQLQPGQPIERPTDIWALGLLAFRAITGKHFWEVANQEKYSDEVLLKDVANELLPLASERAQTYGPDVESKLPRGFDDWFGSAVVRGMDDRYQTVRQARAPLEKVLEAPPPRVVSNEPAPPVPVARTSKTAIVLVLALVATGVFAFMRLRHPAEEKVSTAPSASKSSFDFSGPKEITKPKLCPAGMANVPGGTYFVASKGDSIAIAPFCLDVVEASVSDYDACVKKGKCNATSLDGAFCNYKERPKKDRHPINCLDWDQAEAYCASSGKRLPTVVEWEWTARGADNGTAFPWGEDQPREQLCWSGFIDRGGLGTCEVKSHPSGVTSFGVHDLAGNVAEWASSPTMTDAERPVVGDSWLSKTSVFGKDQGGRSRMVSRKAHEATNGVRCAQAP